MGVSVVGQTLYSLTHLKHCKLAYALLEVFLLSSLICKMSAVWPLVHEVQIVLGWFSQNALCFI